MSINHSIILTAVALFVTNVAVAGVQISVVQEAVIEPENETIATREQDRFGTWVAVDGDTAIVGAPLDDANGMDAGSAYIFSRNSNGSWSQDAILLADDGAAGDQFGLRVDIDADTAVVGARFHNSNIGAAYVYVRAANGQWSEQAKLTADDGNATEDAFGVAVAVDGDTVLVGAKGALLAGDTGNATGLAYVFTRASNGTWTQDATLRVQNRAQGDEFGSSVALEGDTALIGAQRAARGVAPTIIPAVGSAYVFTRVNGVWGETEAATLESSDGAQDDIFGLDVSLSGDTALISARGDDDTGPNDGAAYIFTRNNDTWNTTEEIKLRATSPSAFADFFGDSVAVNGDVALVGATDQAGTGGAVYVFCRSASGWSAASTILPPFGAFFGTNLAISADTAIVGSELSAAQGALSGRVITYDLFDSPSDLIEDLIVTVMGSNLKQGIENALDAKLDVALMALDDANSGNDDLTINMLNLFQDFVDTQVANGHLDPGSGAALNADAQAIIDLLTGQ